MGTIHEQIEDLTFTNIIEDRFGRYSKYIIQDRALPDIRDGLKPVQRRILYAMYQDRNTSNQPYRKSAKTVGNVIGNFHPHGDSSVYEAMVRMGQDWKFREPLIDMHGNKGSMDGDPPAAMRYTEARLAKISDALLQDINHETVDYALNFDDTLEEPVVLPARFPNLLVNGATGISAGYATDIPPHNLAEVIDAVIHLIQHPNCTVEDLLTHIQGPDFPTGGIIYGQDELKEAYRTGQGKIVVRGKTEIEKLKAGKSQIVITELPYEVNKSKLVQKLDEIRLDSQLEGIVEVRDESDRNGVRVVVELKRDVNPQDVLNYLIKHSEIEVNYHFNMVAIYHRQPVLANLKTMIEAYVEHQQEVIERRTRHLLTQDQDRLHIVDGLIHLMSILDEVIHVIRASENKADAKSNIMKQFDFTEPQAESIVSLQLYRLTNTDIVALQNERLELNERIAMYHNILNNSEILDKVVIQELKEIKKMHATPRLTQVEAEIKEVTIDATLLIPEEQVIVSVTNEGYIKRTSRRSFQSSDTYDLALREMDYTLFLEPMSTYDTLILLTSHGNYLYIPVHELPDIRWKDMGVHLSQHYKLEADERILGVYRGAYHLDQAESRDETTAILMLTQQGMIKQTLLKDFVQFRSYRSRSSMAMKLKAGDQIVATMLTQQNEPQQLLVTTYDSYCVRYPVSEVSTLGLKAQGVIAVNLRDDDYVVSGNTFVEDAQQFVVLTQRGNIKRFRADEIPSTSRAARGLTLLKELKSQPHRIIDVLAVDETTPVVVQGDTGHFVELTSEEIPLSARLTNGSAVQELDQLGRVVALHPANLTLADQEDTSDSANTSQ